MKIPAVRCRSKAKGRQNNSSVASTVALTPCLLLCIECELDLDGGMRKKWFGAPPFGARILDLDALLPEEECTNNHNQCPPSSLMMRYIMQRVTTCCVMPNPTLTTTTLLLLLIALLSFVSVN